MEVRIEQTADGKRLQDAINKLTNCSAKVGWFEGQPYPDGTPVAQVAIEQEYGVPFRHVPPRPFMGPTIAKHQKEWTNDFQRGSEKILKDEMTIEQVFGLVASKATGQIKETITQVFTPPLAVSTILARLERKGDKTSTEGLTKPLIDTKHLYLSVDYRVEKS